MKKVVRSASKAAKEAAKIANNSIQAGRDLASFFNVICGEGFKQLGGAFNDWASVYRYENALKLADRIEELHQQRRLAGKTIPIPPRLAIPVIQAATLETDETLRDMWATLIANATDPNRHVDARRAFVELLASLEPLDATVLKLIRNDEIENPQRHSLIWHWSITPHAPGDLPPAQRNFAWLAEKLDKGKTEVIFSLENLHRLGLILDEIPDDMPEILAQLSPTHVVGESATLGLTFTGRALLQACSE